MSTLTTSRGWPPSSKRIRCRYTVQMIRWIFWMLRSGRYPYYLRSRIESNRGHLSNDECSAKLLELIQEGCKKFALCHLSQENNTPALALQTMFNTLGAAGVVPEKDCIVQAQRRNEISPTLTF